ncbi:hypothetical protein GOV11_03960 [Candidatus Woesearchaeota archaeon]|nr:hypothetical protein [Candidatus Woesearchaeota archaeon]
MRPSTLGKQAYKELYGKEPKHKIIVSYHARFSDYNANIRMSAREIKFNLSRKFEKCEPEIQKGVMQFLLNRMKKTKIQSDNIDLYNTFIKKMSDFAPVTETEDVLEESFWRVNETYFHGMMSLPNLKWGNRSRALLGTYTYATDFIMISRILEDAPVEVLDSVMYHEMLHKKHKFSCKAGRTHSHTPAFKKDEARFKPKNIEQILHRFLRGQKARPAKKSFVSRVMGWD